VAGVVVDLRGPHGHTRLQLHHLERGHMERGPCTEPGVHAGGALGRGALGRLLSRWEVDREHPTPYTLHPTPYTLNTATQTLNSEPSHPQVSASYDKLVKIWDAATGAEVSSFVELR